MTEKTKIDEHVKTVINNFNFIGKGRAERIVLHYIESGLCSESDVSNIIDLINKNVYKLTEVKGVGFATADMYAANLGVNSFAPIRLEAATKHIMATLEATGSVKVPHWRFLKLAKKILQRDDTDEIEESEIIRELLKYGHEDLALLNGFYFNPKIRAAEFEILEYIKRKLKEPADRNSVGAYVPDIELTSGQVDAIEMVKNNNISILIGYAGTGKTTVVRSLLQCFKRVCLLAPTGKAAKRLEESTGHKAATIHSGACIRGSQWEATPINIKKDSPDPNLKNADLVVIDEASMLDVRMAWHIVRAISPSARLLLVGDPAQLPSIGVGNVLNDLLNKKEMPRTKLTEILRQKNGGLSDAIAKIRGGYIPRFQTYFNRQNEAVFIEAKTDEEIAETVIDLYMNKLPALGVPMERIQILTPQKSTPAGCDYLNERIQIEQLQRNNSATISVPCFNGVTVFADGDPVVQTVNNYDTGILNGEPGTVTIQDGRLFVQFANALQEYTSKNIEEIRLSYALTVHKSQGSEYGSVIIPMTKAHQFTHSKELLYTAITRAREKAVFVGQFDAFSTALHKHTPARFTFL